MSYNKDGLRWLLAEMPKLRGRGVLDDAAAEALTKYCHDELDLKPPPHRFIYTLFYVGAGMIAAGIVLFFNYNWDFFSKPQRLAIAAIPLALAFVSAMITILGQKGQLWREFSAVLTSVAAATLIGVVGQIYHTGGTLGQYVSLVLLVSLPFVYIFNSIALTTLYSFGLFLLLSRSGLRPMRNFYCFLGAFGILPMLHIQISGDNPNRVWARYLMAVIAVFGLIGCGFDGGYAPLSCFALAGTMIYAGWRLSERHETYLRNPWLWMAFIFMLTLLGIASTYAGFFDAYDSTENVWNVWAYWLFTGVVLATNIRLFPKSRLDAKRLATGLAVLLPLLYFCHVPPATMKIVFNVYMGVYGGVLMLDGFKRGRLLTYNGGIMMVLLLIICRFFDADLGVLPRAIAFVTIGAVLIAANFIFFRKRFREGR
ncbi:MAG: DUF2157 domain-containing protein [Lentisphaeria bacterium]|nr:DUF2157 domain-containing protein [Lentisphaeria bacterium]